MDERVVHVPVGVYEQVPEPGESPKSRRQSRIQDRILLKDGEGVGIVAGDAPPARGDQYQTLRIHLPAPALEALQGIGGEPDLDHLPRSALARLRPQ